MSQDQQKTGLVGGGNRMGAPTAVSADLLQLDTRRLSVIMIALVGLVAVFVIWSSWARLEEVTKGQGRVIPASKIQVVQSLEGGIVREILVKEGAIVAKDDLLLRIDPTLADASAGETKQKIFGLRAQVSRLTAEIEGHAPVFDTDLAVEHQLIVSQQKALYSSRQRGLKASIAAFELVDRQRAQEILEAVARADVLKRSLSIAQAELEMLEPLVRSRAASRAELLTARAKLNDVEGNLKAIELSLPRLRAAQEEAQERKREKIETFKSEALQLLSAAQVELAQLNQTLLGNKDRVNRTTMKSPARGIVKTVSVTTSGQVVKPGESLVEIVPINDNLLIEAQVKPQDIAFLRPGQDAVVKISAYDFSIYRGLEGKVVQIGADSVTTEKGESYYVIRVRTDKSYLEHSGKKLPIIPGMVAEVSVLTGAKTVMAYLTKPLTRMRNNALTER